MVTVAKPKSTDTEQFNTIRTNITFSSVDKKFKSIMLTSSGASEGKSTVAANVAASFAKQGMKTLLVDADLRRPTIASTFDIASTQGLTNFLTDKNFDINEVIYPTTVENLYVIPAGPVPPNPSELIGSKRMKMLKDALTEKLDLVIFDAPPVLSVTDAQLLSVSVDGTILVVRQGEAEKEALRYAMQSDIFVLTSLWEGLPMSLLESMYLKKLCIVSDVVGNHDVIKSGINGYVCNTAEEFVNAINSLENEKLVDTAFEQILSELNTGVMANKYSKIYFGNGE